MTYFFYNSFSPTIPLTDSITISFGIAKNIPSIVEPDDVFPDSLALLIPIRLPLS